VQKGLIWTGSNDGLVYVTRDDGKTWSNVTPASLPPGGRVQNIEPSQRRAGSAYVAIYRYLLGDFAPYIYRTDDFGKTWTRLTDGTNGIAADEPTRVVREDPDRAGLLYAGTEFGIHVSFDNGARWQALQLNLPVTPVTDIKIAHQDLVLSTQGRSFWVLDDLTPLHQITDKTQTTVLFQPRQAVREPARFSLEGLGPSRSALQYPRPGAMIDYYLADAPPADIKLEILDAGGKPVRTFSSETKEEPQRDAGAGGDDEEDFRPRGAPARLEKTAGMHRFIWDLRYPGPWQSETRPEGPNGPTAVPGKYAVRLTVGSWTSTQSLTVIEDPRVTKDGVTTADLREQFEHNLRVRNLVSDVNRTVARLKAAQKDATGEQAAKLAELSSHLITPSIRYSKPELQTHITYLYSLTTGTDQKIGRDAIARYSELRKELDEKIADLNKIVGRSK
jgi:hypothetical protein